MSKNSEMKKQFRASKEWKDYRLLILIERGNKCECCGNEYKKTSSLNLHHRDLDPANYKDLSDKSKHTLLCQTCHKTVHFLHNRVISKKNPTTNKAIIDLQSPFFI